ncbi:hypothetical protein CK203_091993 [Vitis vinifera]|uniref:Uncharacterized protein n=1 Tax=Vitis vinifera TaxID=29760 RepID=A0A438DEW5_VITVI|nr:hypothetical protein CK203_091993 [Vitis vinifera]
MNKRFLVSGLEDSLRIRRPFGSMCWKQSMVRRIMVGGPKKAVGACGVGVWKEILKEAGWCWDKWGSRWGKVIKSASGLMCGAGIQCLSQRRLESAFIRDFNDWEVVLVGELLQALRGVRISWEDDSVFFGKEGKWAV